MLQRAFNDIAGTSANRYANFIDQVLVYHKTWIEYFSGKFLKQEPLTTVDFDTMPKFVYAEEPFGAIFARIAASMAGLLVVVAGLTAIAFGALRRYRVAAR